MSWCVWVHVLVCWRVCWLTLATPQTLIVTHPNGSFKTHKQPTSTYMLLYSLLAASRLCCVTARSSTVVWSGSSARWWGLSVRLNASTSSLGAGWAGGSVRV
jgi:hypothetical protein